MKRRRRDVLFACAFAAGLLVLLEVGLRVLGIGGSQTEQGAAVFDRGAAYLVSDPEAQGGWITQFQEPVLPDIVVPPKAEAKRAILFGASNTRSLGTRRLAEALGEAPCSDPYEVINLGRNAYGSERLSIVFEQAMRQLEPDLAIVYLGDNELVELPLELREMEEVEELSTFIVLARRFRTVGLLHQLFTKGRTLRGQVPEPFVPMRPPSYKHFTYERTLERFEGLRENLRRMCRVAREEGVRLVLCTVVYNRLSQPRVSRFPASMARKEVKAFESLRKEARGRIPTRLDPLLPERPQHQVMNFDWRDRKRQFPPSDTLPGRRPCFGPLANQKPHNTPPRRWNPKVWVLFDALESFHGRDLSEEERTGLVRAETLLSEALEAFPRHGVTQFELGLVKYLLERDPKEVLACLENAADYDCVPHKSNRIVNRIIREVAAEFPEVLLYDADAYLSSLMPDELLGWEFMRDHCHMAYGARIVLIRDLARAVCERWP